MPAPLFVRFGSAEGSNITKGGASGDTSPGGVTGSVGAAGTNNVKGNIGNMSSPCPTTGELAPANPRSVQNCE